MNTQSDYTPPKVWQWTQNNGGAFANINRPVSGATHEKELPIGQHPFQLYSLGTPNGQKVTILLEELLEAGKSDAEYDAHLINIREGEQFSSGFVSINPNSKIPALVDRSGAVPVSVFESGAILLYLAEKFGMFIPQDPTERIQCLSWLFWQMGSAPFVGGGFGHFYSYAPIKLEYAIDRYTMETKRQLDLLDKHLSDKEFICGGEYTIADIAIWPWYGNIVLGALYDAAEFLNVGAYEHLQRWASAIAARPAVKRGKIVNKTWGPLEEQLHERHNAEDFALKTQDKIRQL